MKTVTLGSPQAMYLSAKGHQFCTLKNLSAVRGISNAGRSRFSQFISPQERIAVRKQLTGNVIDAAMTILLIIEFTLAVVRDKPHAFVHHGEQRCVPFSMTDRRHAVLTQVNNVA